MEIHDRLTENLVLLITMPILLYAIYISSLYFRYIKLSISTFTIYIIAGIGFIAYCLFKLIKLLKLRRSYRLGYEGEITVGQELNQFMRDGYYVYHDFPVGKFNLISITLSSDIQARLPLKQKPDQNRRQRIARQMLKLSMMENVFDFQMEQMSNLSSRPNGRQNGCPNDLTNCASAGTKMP